jgi:hypothetical protein
MAPNRFRTFVANHANASAEDGGYKTKARNDFRPDLKALDRQAVYSLMAHEPKCDGNSERVGTGGLREG